MCGGGGVWGGGWVRGGIEVPWHQAAVVGRVEFEGKTEVWIAVG